MNKITASIVLYHNNQMQFEKAIQSFLNGCGGVITVVDNSQTQLKSDLFKHERVRYVFSGKNLGFGAGHNLAVKTQVELSDYHIIINPDVRFDKYVIRNLLTKISSEPDIGAIMPKVLFPDGEIQKLCKLLPTPLDLIVRRFIPFRNIKEKINRRYELHDMDHENSAEVPSMSGCFLMFSTILFKSLNGFDERYFMYMEDVDLIRRINDYGRIVYDPSVAIYHDYAKESYINTKLLMYHIESAIKYFYKWGWFYDPVRFARNNDIINKINEK